ncbi:DinB family protein [Streptomyces sp. NPDC048290]|uniref:DinB family protein n=1 Tax=Streptomyces sp. NPDC048290 TaxID=3155811 RepID=UPI0034278D21
MISSRSELLRGQSELAWSLLAYHLDRLAPGDLLWEPAPLCWTLRQDAAGHWVPDWADTEPDPVPVPTLGWVSWHLGWWLGTATDHLHGRTPRERTGVRWPGDDPAAVTGWLGALRDDWLDGLDRLTDDALDRPCAFPWGEGTDRTLGHTVAWANAELMKNIAEIGQLRLLRTALAHGRVPAV